jgi:hypothetical protein
MANKKSQKRDRKNKRRSSAKKTSSSVKGGSCNCGKNPFFNPMSGGFADDGKHYIEQPSLPSGGFTPANYYSLNNYAGDPQNPSSLHDARLDSQPNTTPLYGGDKKKEKKEKKNKSSKKKGGKRSTVHKKKVSVRGGGVISDMLANQFNTGNFPNFGKDAISTFGNISGTNLGVNTLLGNPPNNNIGVYPINPSGTALNRSLV